jgi:uroporphyrinogen-III synthase
MRAIVTRPHAQAQSWVAQLEARGIRAAALPLIRIDPAPDPAAVQRAWREIESYTLLVFVSPNAVDAFFGLRPAGQTWPPAVLAGSTGPGTSAALREHGVPDASIVEPAADAKQFDSEALWAQLADRDWQGRAVLLVRGEGGRDWLGQTLAQAGATVDALAAYRRAEPRLDDAARALLAAAQAEPRTHAWLFSSSEAIDNLKRLAPQAQWRASIALTTHPRIGASARAAGFGDVIEIRTGVDAAVAALRGLQGEAR